MLYYQKALYPHTPGQSAGVLDWDCVDHKAFFCAPSPAIRVAWAASEIPCPWTSTPQACSVAQQPLELILEEKISSSWILRKLAPQFLSEIQSILV